MNRRIAVVAALFSLCGFAYSQKMTVKDSENNILMQVNDEGNAGSITLPHGPAPSTITYKLYNVLGSLYWNGHALALSEIAGGWTEGDAVVYTTTPSDKVGIGTTTPEFKLTLDNDGGILAKGSFGSSSALTTTGAGTRLIWHPNMAAFRAGRVDGAQWDESNIGIYSTAMGYSTTASGSFSTALGYNTTASGMYATASGFSTTAGGYYSTAMGYSTQAGGQCSVAMNNSTVANGSLSTAMGFLTTAESFAELVIGRCNEGTGSGDTWFSADPIFEIGIGSDPDHRANALTVIKNGWVGIGAGKSNPFYLLDMQGGGFYNAGDGQWHNSSSRAVKRDIGPNTMDLNGILDRVDVVNFRYRAEVERDADAPFHIGFIAEDAPELLSGRDRNSMSTGDCIGFLLAVVKEQQRRIEDLETDIAEMKK